MNIFSKLRAVLAGKAEPEHLRRGKLGEQAARAYLERQGLKFLVANFRSERGEIDLIFLEKGRKSSETVFTGNGTDCLAFVEVKTRAPGGWTRPAAAVNARKRRLLSQTALDYLAAIHNPRVKIRFDIIEVLMTGDVVTELRHLPNTFPMARPYRYG